MHERSPSHQNVLVELQKEYVRGMTTEAIDHQHASEERDDAFFKATARMLRTAFVIAKYDFPLNSHEALVRLQKVNGVDLGEQFATKDGATMMWTAIGRWKCEVSRF